MYYNTIIYIFSAQCYCIFFTCISAPLCLSSVICFFLQEALALFHWCAHWLWDTKYLFPDLL